MRKSYGKSLLTAYVAETWNECHFTV